MLMRKFLISLAAIAFLLVSAKADIYADDDSSGLSSLTITFKESNLNSGANAHSVSSFQPSVDLGTIAGLAQGVIDKMLEFYFNGTGGASGGAGGVQGMVNQYIPTLNINPNSGPKPQSMNLGYGGTPIIRGNFTGNNTLIINPNQLGNNTSVFIVNPAQNATAQSQNTTTIPSVVMGNATMITLPAGSGYTTQSTTHSLTVGDFQQDNQPFTTIGGYVDGLSYSLPLKIFLDTLWAPKPNASLQAKMKLSWTYTKGELNQINMQRAGGSMVPFGTIGQLSLSTEEFKFKRECGIEASVGLAAVWKGKDKNLTSISFTDIGVNINDPSDKNNNLNDPLGSQGANHADSMFLSELAQKIISALSSSAKSSAKSAGDESLGMKFVNKVVGNLGVKVNVVQKTRNRKATITFEVKAKDFSNKVYDLPVADSGVIVFDQENHLYPLNVTFPPDFPPLKEISVKIKEAKYQYEEIGYPEILITADFFPGEGVSTGPIMEGSGAFTNLGHEVTDFELTLPGVTVSTDEKPVVIQVRGTVETGEPRIPLQGAQVKVFHRASGHDTIYADTLTGPPGDFIGDIVKTVKENQQVTVPSYIISASKQGFGAKASNTDSANFVKTQNDPARYTIYLPLSPEQIFSLSGRVLEQDGATGVAQAAVFAQIGRGGEMVMGVTDANGNYNLPAIYAAPLLIISAQKNGYSFESKEYTTGSGSGVKSAVVDIKSVAGRLWGVAKFNFTAQAGTLPQSVDCKRGSHPTIFGVNITSGSAELSIIGSNKDTFTFSKDGYVFSPATLTAEFTGNEQAISGTAWPKKEYSVSAVSTFPSAVTLAMDNPTLERYGELYNPPNANEKTVLTASVKDASGKGVPNMNVSFEISDINKIKVIQQGQRPQEARPDRAYAKTDSTGNAAITVVAKRDLGSVVFTPVAYDQYLTYVVRGSGYSLNIVENTRPERNAKPRGSFTLEAAALGLSGPGVRISKGGDILFHLNCDMNGVAGNPSGYNLRLSRNNGTWQENLKNSFHPVDRMTFNEAGTYAVQFLVKRTFDEVDYWSDPAEATFSVADYQPPQAILTLTKTSGAVNIPIDYSFNTQVSAPYQKILLTFGDNKQDFDIDAGLLNGKFSWSGSYYHTYDAQGTYTITLKVIDQTNNFKEVTKSVTIGSIASLNDNTAPTGTLSISLGAATTSVTGVGLRITGSDSSSGVYRFRVSNDNSNWSSWNSIDFANDRPSPTVDFMRAWQLTDGAGTKTVYVQLKDAADNVSPTITDTIELQASSLQASGALPAPQATVTGYQGAPMPHGSIAITSRSGNNISVTFSATNDWAIFVNQMALSFDNQSWASWVPFEPNKQISLTGHLDATKIYVIFADMAGGQSPAYSADIPAAAQNQQPAQTAGTGQSQTQDNTQAAQSQGNTAGQTADQAKEQTTVQGKTAEQRQITQKGEQREEQSQTIRTQQRARAQQQGQTSVSTTTGITKETAASLPLQAARSREITKLADQPPAQAEPIDVSVDEIRLSREIFVNEKTEIEVYLRNNAAVNVENCVVNLEAQDGFSAKEKISLRGRSREKVKFSWTPKETGRQRLTAMAECEGDTNRSNNKATQMAEVIARQNEIRGKEKVELISEPGRLREKEGKGILREKGLILEEER
jgi:hypothetical protein